jgi:hypothetical protein
MIIMGTPVPGGATGLDLSAAGPQPLVAANGVDTFVARGGELPPVLIAASGGGLESLLAEYVRVKEQADSYAQQLKTITDKIKLHAIGAVPGTNALVLRNTAGYGPLKLACHDRTSFDRKRFKIAHPEVDTKPFESTTTVWTLRAVSG